MNRTENTVMSGSLYFLKNCCTLTVRKNTFFMANSDQIVTKTSLDHFLSISNHLKGEVCHF